MADPDLTVGQDDSASVRVADGAALHTTSIVVAEDNAGTGATNIDAVIEVSGVSPGGTRSTLTADDMTVGENGEGWFRVGGGALASTGATTIVHDNSRIEVVGTDGAGNPSRWNAGRVVAFEGRTLARDSAVASIGSLDHAANTHVDTGAVMTIAGLARIGLVGENRPASVFVGSGGRLLTSTVHIGEGGHPTSQNLFFVDDSGGPSATVWHNSADVYLAGSDSAPGKASQLLLDGQNARAIIDGRLKIWQGGFVELTQGATLEAGHIQNIDGGVFNFTEGTLHVDRFDGDLENLGGVLAPGPGIGMTSIGGIYIQRPDATLAFDIGGTDPGVAHDLLTVLASVQLDGNLDLAMMNGFVPAPTDTFTVMQTNFMVGGFGNVSTGDRLATTDGRGSFVVNYGFGSAFDPSQIVLSDFLLEAINVDFNSDGLVNCSDVDALVADIAAGMNTPLYDLTGDSIVDRRDLTEWLAQAGARNLPSGNSYLEGDANLDGIVDGLDFIDWNTNKFTQLASWCGGDFDADGIVDGLDYILWNGNKFTGADANSPAVPEPASGLIAIALVVIVLQTRR